MYTLQDFLFEVLWLEAISDAHARVILDLYVLFADS